MALNCRSSNKPVTEPCGVCDSCREIRAGNSVDVIEIDAATNRGIDEIRELREAARYRPARDRFKIYILDEAHQITDAAFNALLKTLEEPPSHVVFMMATTQPEDIPQTIRSRCQHFSFHAVKFDDIVGQLRDIVAKEHIPADDDALALLAEAGDGSMRDALSIMDQAIASTSDHLTADSVRGLIGSAPATALETVMQAIAESASEKILVLVDELIGEGHSPTHFARQLLRFIRNVTVAKIAGKDSPLLQVSSDERARAGRVAELFSEEDLARLLHIMLRTHGELGYRQEQRFHLELGLLKMAHAQRLLPIEQLLSDVSLPVSGASRSVSRPVLAPPNAFRPLPYSPETRRPEPPSSARSNPISPFAADSARKGTPKADASNDSPPTSEKQGMSAVDGIGCAPQPSNTTGNLVIMGSAAPAIAELEPEPAPPLNDEPPALIAAKPEINVDSLRDAVLNALSNQQMLVSILETARWTLTGNILLAQAAASSAMIEMSLTADARRIGAEPLQRCGGSTNKNGGRVWRLRATGAVHSAPRSQRKCPQPSRARPHRATHAGQIRGRDPYRHRLSGEAIS